VHVIDTLEERASSSFRIGATLGAYVHTTATHLRCRPLLDHVVRAHDELLRYVGAERLPHIDHELAGYRSRPAWASHSAAARGRFDFRLL